MLLVENDSALKVAEQIPFRGFVIYKPVANKKECNLIPPYAYVFFMLVVKTEVIIHPIQIDRSIVLHFPSCVCILLD